MVFHQLYPSMFSGAEEDNIFHLERVLLVVSVGTLDVPVLMLPKDGCDMSPVSQKSIEKLLRPLLQSSERAGVRWQVEVESRVVTEVEIVVWEVGVNERCVVYSYFDYIENIEPGPIFVLSNAK